MSFLGSRAEIRSFQPAGPWVESGVRNLSRLVTYVGNRDFAVDVFLNEDFCSWKPEVYLYRHRSALRLLFVILLVMHFPQLMLEGRVGAVALLQSVFLAKVPDRRFGSIVELSVHDPTTESKVIEPLLHAGKAVLVGRVFKEGVQRTDP